MPLSLRVSGYFSSPKEIWFIIRLGAIDWLIAGQGENKKENFLFCVNVFIIFDMLTDYEMKVSDPCGSNANSKP